MEHRLSCETVAYHESLRTRANLEEEKSKAIQDVKTITGEATAMRQKLDDAVKTADMHRRDYLAAQREASDLRNVISMKEGKDENQVKQIAELQLKLLDAQNQWSRCDGDAKVYMEIAQTRQKSIDELTTNIKAMEAT